MSTFRLQSALYYIGIALVLWVAVSFVYAPIYSVLTQAFVSDGGLSIGSAVDLAKSNRVRSAIVNTVIITVLSIITVNVVGIFKVAALEYVSVKGACILKVAYAMPLVFVSVVAATGYNFTYGQTGVVTCLIQSVFPALPNDWFSGIFAVVFAHTFLLRSFHYLFLGATFRRVDYSVIEVARSLGASNLCVFVSVVLPLLLPTIFAIPLLVAYKSLGSFAIPAVVGGRRFDMVTELILTLNSLRRPDMAGMLSIALGLAVIICILIMQRIERKGSYSGGSKTPVPIQKIELPPPVNLIVHACAYGIAFLQLFPVSLVVLFSFAPAKSIISEVVPSTLSLKNYIEVFSGGEVLTPLKNSLLMGACSCNGTFGKPVRSNPCEQT